VTMRREAATRCCHGQSTRTRARAQTPARTNKVSAQQLKNQSRKSWRGSKMSGASDKATQLLSGKHEGAQAQKRDIIHFRICTCSMQPCNDRMCTRAGLQTQHAVVYPAPRATRRYPRLRPVLKSPGNSGGGDRRVCMRT